ARPRSVSRYSIRLRVYLQRLQVKQKGGANDMSKKYWVLSMVCACLVRLAPVQADAAPPIIGIALPQGQLGQRAEVAEPLRQSLISQLKAQSVAAVPLAASVGGPL